MPDRDEKGRLLPGHAPTFHGFKAGQNVGGAPKSLTTEVKDALRIAEDAMPNIIRDMIDRAQDKTVPCAVRQAAAEYLCDRIYGRPNQPLSNKDGTKLTSFAFVLPAGFTPMPGGLIGGSVPDSQKN